MLEVRAWETIRESVRVDLISNIVVPDKDSALY